MRGHRLSGRREDGQALVELALVMPLLLVIVFGVLEFGRLLNYWLDQNHIASQGARFAAVNRNPGGGTLASYLQGLGTTDELRTGSSSVSDPLRVCVSFPNGTSNVGDPVRVRATSTYSFLPILDLLPVSVTGEADMRIEVRPGAGIAGCS
jgi:hypothetical protein